MNNQKRLVQNRIDQITHWLDNISNEYPEIIEAIVFGSSVNLNSSSPKDLDIAIVIDSNHSKNKISIPLKDFKYTGRVDSALNYCPDWKLEEKELPIHFVIISDKGINDEEFTMWCSIDKGFSIWKKGNTSNYIIKSNQFKNDYLKAVA